MENCQRWGLAHYLQRSSKSWKLTLHRKKNVEGEVDCGVKKAKLHRGNTSLVKVSRPYKSSRKGDLSTITVKKVKTYIKICVNYLS